VGGWVGGWGCLCGVLIARAVSQTENGNTHSRAAPPLPPQKKNQPQTPSKNNPQPQPKPNAPDGKRPKHRALVDDGACRHGGVKQSADAVKHGRRAQRARAAAAAEARRLEAEALPLLVVGLQQRVKGALDCLAAGLVPFVALGVCVLWGRAGWVGVGGCRMGGEGLSYWGSPISSLNPASYDTRRLSLNLSQ